MWMKAHQSEVFSNMKHVLGSKDYINYRMTGRILTDHSYASGTGGYNLEEARYQEEFWDAAGIDMDLLPKIVPSDTVVGYLTEQAARELGLTTKTAVMAGGVDNACMALGATGIRDGAAYISLGSSSWVPVTACRPVLDFKTRPYVFAHIEPGMYTSAYSIDPETETELSIYVNCGQQFSPHLVLLDCRPQPIRQFIRLQVAGGSDAVV